MEVSIKYLNVNNSESPRSNAGYYHLQIDYSAQFRFEFSSIAPWLEIASSGLALLYEH